MARWEKDADFYNSFRRDCMHAQISRLSCRSPCGVRQFVRCAANRRTRHDISIRSMRRFLGPLIGGRDYVGQFLRARVDGQESAWTSYTPEADIPIRVWPQYLVNGQTSLVIGFIFDLSSLAGALNSSRPVFQMRAQANDLCGLRFVWAHNPSLYRFLLAAGIPPIGSGNRHALMDGSRTHSSFLPPAWSG